MRIFSLPTAALAFVSLSFLVAVFFDHFPRTNPIFEPLKAYHECQATCVSGNWRTFNDKVLQSVLNNAVIVTGGCHHVYVIGSFAKGGSSTYIERNFMSGYDDLKDEDLLFENTIVNDFELDKSAVISETMLRKSVQLEKDVQVKFFHLRPETSQTDKHTFCTKVVEDFEKEMGRKYAVYARTRPDALIYGNLKRLIDFDSLNKSSFIVKTHADTFWIGTEPYNHFRKDPLGIAPRTAFLGWAMCRGHKTVGTFYNYLDPFISGHYGVTKLTIGNFCYRMYNIFGSNTFQGDIEDDTLSVIYNGTKQELGYIPKRALHSYLEAGTSGSNQYCPCCHTKEILEGSPFVKHDIEICNKWEPSCTTGHCALSDIHSVLFEKIKIWATTTRLKVLDMVSESESKERSCSVFVGAACDMLRSLSYMGVALDSGAKRWAFRGSSTLDAPCDFAIVLSSLIEGARNPGDVLYSNQSLQCIHYNLIDCYYWDDDCP